MTLAEAATYVRCSSRKMRDLIQKRRVRHARVGAKIVIRRAWLDDFIDRSG